MLIILGTHPSTLPKSTEQTLILLCKRNSDYVVVDFKCNSDKMTNGDRMKYIHECIMNGTFNDSFADYEFIDIVDADELPEGYLESIRSNPGNETKDSHFDMNFFDRPQSSGSIQSSGSESTFISLLNSGESNFQRSDSAASDFMFELVCEPEWMLNDEAQGFKLMFESDAKVNRGNGRPSTSIALMKLPKNLRPILVLPKSRPASADLLVHSIPTPGSYDIFLDDLRKQKNGKSLKKSELERLKVELEALNFKSKIKSTVQLVKIEKVDTTSNPRVINQCTRCLKKLGPAQAYICKCKSTFCGTHRYSELHACTFEKQINKRLPIGCKQATSRRENAQKI